MLKWQWKFFDLWMDCSEKNNQLLSTRFEAPSMEPIYLANIYGELWGCPEKGKMKFRINDEEEVSVSRVRRCSCDPEATIYAIDSTVRTLVRASPLFEERAEEVRPRSEYTEMYIGTELFVAKDQLIFHHLNGKLQECSWKATDLSGDQFREMTQSRFVWEFNGPFRNERIAAAVTKTCHSITPPQCRKLNRLFTLFNPDEEEATEYGPYQFPDFLCAHGEDELSCQVTDTYHGTELRGWQPFDDFTNAKIEKRRSDGHSAILINVRGQNYMLLFDSGGGASGQPPVIIRPARYSKILNSIEDQFRSSALRELFDVLIDSGVNPVNFLRSDNPERLVSRIKKRELVMRIFHKVTHSSQYIATRIQQFMPALLDKYKECDIRLSQIEHLSPKKLCPVVATTIETGLNIPKSYRFYCHSFRKLIEFIQMTQSWLVDKIPNGDCDICFTSNCVVLHHCGTATACLKCWVDTLVETKMKCPFCRQVVVGGELTCEASEPSAPQARKTKRRRRFHSAADVLSAIHQDTKYSEITLETVNTMRKWFTILVRQHIVDISEMPTLDHSIEKSLSCALTAFKVL